VGAASPIYLVDSFESHVRCGVRLEVCFFFLLSGLCCAVCGCCCSFSPSVSLLINGRVSRRTRKSRRVRSETPRKWKEGTGRVKIVPGYPSASCREGKKHTLIANTSTPFIHPSLPAWCFCVYFTYIYILFFCYLSISPPSPSFKHSLTHLPPPLPRERK